MRKKILLLDVILLVICLSSCLSYKHNNQKQLERLGYLEVNSEYIDYIIENNIPYQDIKDYLGISGFKIDKLNEYISVYHSTPIYYNHKMVVNLVNNPNHITITYTKGEVALKNPLLVNKNYFLTMDYTPKNLITMDQKYVVIKERIIQVESTVSIKIEELILSAKKENLDLYLYSGYRSFLYQEQIYSNNPNDQEIARPGHSEHQTGLAVDVSTKDAGLTENFSLTKEFKWLEENAHLFGFIIRYPKDKENITGFSFEPWHLRYVGIELANIMFTEQLTLEEYYLKYTDMKKNND